MPKAGPEQVYPERDDEELGRVFDIEHRVSQVTPHFFPAKNREGFAEFRRHHKVDTYLWHDDAGHDVGFMSLIPNKEPESMEVLSLVVGLNYQHQGFGKQMMHFVEELARENGFRRLFLATSPENKPAVNLYSAVGYKVIAEKENYYGDGTSRLILEKTITD